MYNLALNFYFFILGCCYRMKHKCYPFIVDTTRVTQFRAQRDIIRYALCEKLQSASLTTLADAFPDRKFVLLAAIQDDVVRVNVYRLCEKDAVSFAQPVYDPQYGVNGFFNFILTHRAHRIINGQATSVPGGHIGFPKDHREQSDVYYDPTDPIMGFKLPLTCKEDALVDDAYHADSFNPAFYYDPDTTTA